MLAPRPSPSDGGPVRPPVPAAVGAVIGLPAGAAAALAAWVFGGGQTTGLVFAAVAALWIGALTTPLGSLGAAALCWACYDGFVVHRFGTLGDGYGDLAALTALAGVALVVSAVAALTRHRTSEPPRRYAAREMPAALPRAGTSTQ